MTPRTDAELSKSAGTELAGTVEGYFARILEAELGEANKANSELVDIHTDTICQLTAARAELEQARRTCAELVTDSNAITLATSLHKMEKERDEARVDAERYKADRNRSRVEARLEWMPKVKELVEALREVNGRDEPTPFKIKKLVAKYDAKSQL